MTIHLYAEHLLNIQTLSIQASLPTFSTRETCAAISADGSALTLTHDKETKSIKLPITVWPKTINLQVPPVPQKDLSFRVPLEKKDGAQLANGRNRDDSIVTPWTAEQLTSETEICCKACSSTVVKRGTIKHWKDLPSEGWAEMMDFWHCHKPDHPDGPHAHGTNGELRKGYTAESKLALESGIGMVDPLDLVFVAEDCSNLKTHAHEKKIHLLCTNPTCAALLGTLDASTQGHRLHKPTLSISNSPSRPLQSFEQSKWLSLHLLTAVELQGVRKFTVPIHSKQKNLKIWVFTPNLLISTSVLKTNQPVRLAKILWREEHAAAAENDVAGKLSRQALAEGELDLWDKEAEQLAEGLRKSAEWLPKASRSFGEWSVGLLERFEKADLEDR